MTLEEMKKLKAEYALTGEMIAKRSGVPLGTVQKVFGGITGSPRKQTLDALEAVFLEEAAKKRRRAYSFKDAESAVVKETAAGYSMVERQEPATLSDYYALPEERRVELIDGQFYDMEAPSWKHQLVSLELAILFRQCVDAHNAPCEVLCAPCDVRLDKDDYTMLQPDLMVVCRGLAEDVRRIEGAPDLVVEILSPSTRRKDQSLKLCKYLNAGVREYWIVDFERGLVIVHYFESEDYHPEIYSFSSSVPIHIAPDGCGIDFARVRDRLERYRR